jgi:glycerol-3-phosphate dehydrogenase (NAD(P)+)
LTRLAIIGGGSWGTALACILSSRFDYVSLWLHEPDLAARVERTRVNDIFLPGIPLPSNVRAEHSLETALSDADVLLSVMPSHAVRDVYTRMLPWLKPSIRIVSASKGLEAGTLLRI